MCVYVSHTSLDPAHMQVKVDTMVGLARFPSLPHTNTLWQKSQD